MLYFASLKYSAIIRSMRILVIDAQGGGLGKVVITALKQRDCNAHIVAVGTNSNATNAMLKAGAAEAATGENSIIVTARKADVIICPIGLVIADSMLGEVTEGMALAIARSDAKKILIPSKGCNNYVAGVKKIGLKEIIDDVVECALC